MSTKASFILLPMDENAKEPPENIWDYILVFRENYKAVGSIIT
jgi:hypothetical protein